MKHSVCNLFAIAAALFLLRIAPAAHAAETVHLFLTMNGVEIQGDSTQISLGRENSIECLSFESEFFRPTGAEVAVHRPIKIVKRIAKDTPLLARSCDRNETGQGTFKFYRPHPSGDGTTQQFFAIALDGMRITSQRLLVPSTINPVTAQDPPLEEVTFTYTSMTVIYTVTGIETEIRVR